MIGGEEPLPTTAPAHDHACHQTWRDLAVAVIEWISANPIVTGGIVLIATGGAACLWWCVKRWWGHKFPGADK